MRPFTMISSSAKTYPPNKIVEYLSRKKHTSGLSIQTTGVALSKINLFLAYNEKAKSPISGP